MFQIGDANVPWLPPAVLAIIGIALLATALKGQDEAEGSEKPKVVIDPEKEALNKRLETIAWGLFLIVCGLVEIWKAPSQAQESMIGKEQNVAFAATGRLSKEQPHYHGQKHNVR